MGKLKLPYVIGFNGPAGIGKSWTCHQLQPLLGGAPGVEIMHLMEVPFMELSRHRIPAAILADMPAEWDAARRYAEFKSTQIGHVTGREVLIDYVESERRKDPLVWCKKMVELQRYRAADLILYESVSVPEEIDFLFDPKHCSSFFPVVIAPSHISPGQALDDGYRVCMPATWGRRFIDSNAAINHFRKIISDALGDESTSKQISVDLFWSQLILGRSVERE